MMYVALVVLDNLKGVDDPLHEIAFTNAETEREATRQITAFQWPREYWAKKKSVCRIKTIATLEATDGFFTRRLAPALDSPTKQSISTQAESSPRRRRRRKSGGQQLLLDIPKARRRIRKIRKKNS